jgi:hypothetical protein
MDANIHFCVISYLDRFDDPWREGSGQQGAARYDLKQAALERFLSQTFTRLTSQQYITSHGTRYD